ncbi:MAG: methionine gamma-lyase family protein [Candidatus Melainabacteria bacterium]|nr:methionine gamma-lyase family protein [Candidatus Melainabacteria bacterium]
MQASTTASTAQTLITQAENVLQANVWPELEAVQYHTFNRVMEAFRHHRVGEEHFYSVSGYGHDDLGREVTDRVFAEALQAEAALVRLQLVSGTHALAVALRGLLHPGDTLTVLTGKPYDTMESVFGLRDSYPHSLTAHGVHYVEHSLLEDASIPSQEGYVRLVFSPDEVKSIEQARVVYLQRSRGYSLRKTLTIAELAAIIERVKAINPAAWVLVDNCYGEFIEPNEPTAVGADLMAGSLIKNPGGGIVPTGGYLAGRADCVARAAEILTCPGIGSEGGYTFNLTRTVLQGLFLAPGVVKEALKGMTLAAWVFQALGYTALPAWNSPRGDIIQTLGLGSAEALQTFCRVLQSVSPVNSFLTPVPAEIPGYADAVIMAGGTFIDGSSIELSADAPLRPPYTLFLQGGLSYAHTRYALERLIEQLPSQ